MKAEDIPLAENVESHLRIVERDTNAHWAELAEHFVKQEATAIVAPLAEAQRELAQSLSLLTQAIHRLAEEQEQTRAFFVSQLVDRVTPELEDWVGVTVAARLLGVHVKTVYRLVREGKVEAAIVGRQYRFSKTNLKLKLKSELQSARNWRHLAEANGN